MKISCIITDDEPVARKGLQGYVQQIPFLTLNGVCEDAMQLATLLQEQKTDLLFLDIEMPYLSGLELLKTLTTAPKVILTTAYENYALQGFELDVLDYLLKPISFERFLKASNKAAEYFKSKDTLAPDHIYIKTDGRLEKVVLEEIIFIEARENYVVIQTQTAKWMTHATLRSVQARLPSHFLQTHKSWIVNSAYITSIEGLTLHCHPFQVPVSKHMRQDVLGRITQGRLLHKKS